MEPKGWHHWISWGAATLGFYIAQQFKPWTWDVYLITGWCYFFAVIFSTGVEYGRYLSRRWQYFTPQETPNDNKPIAKPREIQNLNAVYQQMAVGVKFDMERQFAKTLLIMRDHQPGDKSVNLTEEYWKKPNKFGSRESYIAVRGKWDEYGIIGRESAKKNARFVVRKWDVVQAVADGTKLPPPPLRK